MGSQLVARVEVKIHGADLHLSHAARLVLFGMAFHAHDRGTRDTPQGCYFGGWELLATSWLGYRKLDRAAIEHTRRAVAELVAAELVIVGPRHGGPHGNRTYLLMV